MPKSPTPAGEPNKGFGRKFILVWASVYIAGLGLFATLAQPSLNLLIGITVFGFFFAIGSLFITMIISVLVDLE